MSGKVIHISERAHRRAKEYCDKHNLRMSEWVTNLILNTLDRKSVVTRSTIISKVGSNQSAKPPDDPWTREPFWAQK